MTPVTAGLHKNLLTLSKLPLAVFGTSGQVVLVASTWLSIIQYVVARRKVLIVLRPAGPAGQDRSIGSNGDFGEAQD